MKSLDAFIKEGRKFDYIFGDLTDIPISDSPSSELWGFIMKVMEKSFKILKPNGKFMTHVSNSNIHSKAEYGKKALNPRNRLLSLMLFIYLSVSYLSICAEAQVLSKSRN